MINIMATHVTGDRNQTLYKTAKIDDKSFYHNY